MSDPQVRTFDLLATTGNLQAVDLLLLALDGRDAVTRERAAFALLRRSSTRGHLEVLRRFNNVSPEVRAQVEKLASHMAPAVRQALLHGDFELRQNALNLVRSTENFDQMPTLLELLDSPSGGLQQQAADAVRELIDRLYDSTRPEDDDGQRRHLRHAVQLQQKTIVSLDQACGKFADLDRPEIVVEGILILGDPDNFAVRKVLGQGNAACRELAYRLLVTSRHPGVMQLLVDFLSKNYPPTKVFEAIQSRNDLDFACHLLRWFPKRLSQQHQRNFRQLTALAWLDEPGLLEMIPVALHPQLVEFIAGTGLSTDKKLDLQEWLLRNGNPQGRLAAAHVLASLDDEAVQDIIFEGLDAEDADLQAWAVGQLRAHQIPEAITLLVQRLDSPLEAVRQAARDELSSFNIERMLSLFEQLDPQVCLNAGRLIQKIEPDCLVKLAVELDSPIRRRRMRAARGAKALGLHVRVVPALLRMLDDEDPLVRRTVLDVLSDVPTAESIEAIQRHCEDESPRVREAAMKALEHLREHLPIS